MNLKEMIRGANLPITMRHERWLETNSTPKYTETALDFARAALSHELGGNRSRSSDFRASGAGSCQRRQLFTANDVRGITDISSDLANIFATGNFLHLKWQMAGLTEGWLVQAEVPYESDEYSFGGTLDGIIYDGSLFEFKSINARGFSSVQMYGPKHDHILQAHAYMYLADLHAVSFVYENKDNGEWREFRMERDDLICDAIVGMVNDMTEMKRNQAYPEPLNKCLDREGWQYRQCPFREVCLDEKWEPWVYE